MKKWILLLLVAVMCLSLVFCDRDSGTTDNVPQTDETTTGCGNNSGWKLHRGCNLVVGW